MIKGDKGKRMNIMEYISDEPVDCEPYLEYCIRNERAHRDNWFGLPNDRDEKHLPTAKECVLAHLDGFIITLEDALMKLRRERSEQPPSAGAVDPSVDIRERRPRAHEKE